MGTPLRNVIESIGGGPRAGREIKVVLSGVATGVIPQKDLDTPVSYEGLSAIGSGVGSGGFIVFDDTADIPAIAAGVARFLAIESCGQCSPCKLDGLTLADSLAKLNTSQAKEHDLDVIRHRIGTVADRSRCFLASQQQAVLTSLLEHFPDEFDGHVTGSLQPVEPVLVAELLDIRNDQAIVDERHWRKQPDWTYNRSDSGTVPVEFYAAVPSPWRF
jgi:NADH:ubiquinone oxidoreductase subunit F (NADH-binding)